MRQRKLTGLSSKAFEHPLDQAALAALKHNAGFEKFIAEINEWGFERFLRVQLVGSYLHVTEDNFPDLYRVLCDACEILDVRPPPDLYIAPGSDINAFTTGTTRPLIVVTSGAIDALDSDELLFIIAHEIGHIMCGHSLYYAVAEFLPVLARTVGAATFGIGELLGVGLEAALLHWKRMSEFSSDRAGLLACQNADAAISTMIKIAGLPTKYYGKANPEDFITQAKSFQLMDSDAFSRFAKYMSTFASSHPWTVARANQFLDWYDGGGYGEVLNSPGKIPVKLPPGVKSFCTSCGYALKTGEAFCPGCGTKLLQSSFPGS